MPQARDAILGACLQILGVAPGISPTPDYDSVVYSALIRVLLSGLTISPTGAITTTTPLITTTNLATVTGTLAATNGGTGLATVAANRLLYASALNTLAALVSANNGVLVTSSSGVPSISVTLPSGLTITAPILSGSVTGTYTLAGTPTITAPAISAPVLSGSATGTYTLAGTPTITSPTISNPTVSGTMAAAAATFSGTVSPAGLVDASGASAGQVKFPATQNASSNANTLDDYDERSWTPVLGGAGGTSGQTYTTQLGRAVKTGRKVCATFQVTLSAKGTITGAVQIQGLPYTADATVGASAALPYYVTLNTNWVSLGGYLFPSTTALAIYGNTAAAATVTALATGDITNTTEIRGTVTYLATA